MKVFLFGVSGTVEKAHEGRGVPKAHRPCRASGTAERMHTEKCTQGGDLPPAALF